MSALTEEGPGQSTCRAVSATPLQIYNMHVTEYIPGIDVKPSPVAGPRLSSCPVHKDIPCIAKIPHCLPWHQLRACSDCGGVEGRWLWGRSQLEELT